MGHIRLGTFFSACVLSLGAQQTQPSLEYHSPSEAWLPFFQSAVQRFVEDGKSAEIPTECLRDAQATVAGVNRMANSLVKGAMQADVAQYLGLVEDFSRASQRAAEADKEFGQLAQAEAKYNWMTPRDVHPSDTASLEAARAGTAKAHAEMETITGKVAGARAQLAQKFASSVGPHEETASRKMNELAQKVEDEARAKGVTSKVKVRTMTPGAIVHFQSMGERLRSDPGISSQKLTNDSEDTLPIGKYYIWTERNNAPSSSKDRFLPVVDARVTVDIAENQL